MNEYSLAKVQILIQIRMKKAIILCLALSCAIAFDLMTDLSPWHR